MKDQKLLASIAVFRELYNRNEDIYDVITSFIRSAIVLESCWSINASGCTELLKKHYGFELPEAVVKTCLKNRLKDSGELVAHGGQFLVTDKFDKSNKLEGHDVALENYERIILMLTNSIKALSKDTADFTVGEISKCFNEYILNPNYKNDYTNEISHFIISNMKDEDFKNSINKIEEGLILYTGVRYTSEINELGTWDNDLSIYLDTEILFSAAGLNGELYQKLFNEFHQIVDNANRSKYKSGKIKLCYFTEAEEEINSFFYAAEKVFERNQSIDPSKTAMHFIIDGCKGKSDVVAKKVQFYDKLRRLKVTKEEDINYYENPVFNLECVESIEMLKDRFNHKDDDYEYSKILKLFTKINVLRKGESSVGIDKVKAMMISAKRLTLNASYSDVIRKNTKEIPFATHIDFMTERLWFKLNVGFGGNQSIPTSFLVVTKAQLALASQVSSHITEEYKELQSRLTKGQITRELATLINTDLRVKHSKPEDINSDTVDEALEYLNTDSIEKILREKAILEHKSKQGEIAHSHLRKLQDEEKEKVRGNLRKIAVKKIRLRKIIAYSLLPCLALMIIFFAKSTPDTMLSLIAAGVTMCSFIIQVINNNKVDKFIFKRVAADYKYNLGVQYNAIVNKYTSSLDVN